MLEKLQRYDDQWEEVSMVMSDKAKMVWEREPENKHYEDYPFHQFEKMELFELLHPLFTVNPAPWMS